MNAIAKIGHNRSAFDLAKEKIEDLYSEAKNWLDGEPIASQDQADAVQKLMRMIQAAETEADKARVEENKPFDEGKAAVQAKYAPLIADTKTKKGLTVRAIDACKKALTPWLVKVEEENQRKAEEARKEAEAKQLAALEAAQHRDSLEGSEQFEVAVREAKQAEADARRLGNAKAAAKGEGRAVTLRDYYEPEITSMTDFARHVWTAHRSDMEQFLNGMAVKIVAAGSHSGIPGVTVRHERRPV